MGDEVQRDEIAYWLEKWSGTDWAAVAPAERLDTLPAGVPSLTLGWGVIRWVSDNIVHPHTGEPFRLTERQARFVLWFYAVDEVGDFVFTEGVRRLSKGSGKSPFAAVLALVQLLGPVRFVRFDPGVIGGCVGSRWAMSWVQVAATAEEQTKNTMRMIRAMVNHKKSRLKRDYQLEVGKTYIETADGCKLEQITSAASTAEGNEITFCIADETEHWTPVRGGKDLYEVLGRNLGKTRNARMLQTSNAWEPGAQSVAELTFDTWVLQEEGKGNSDKQALYDSVRAPDYTSLAPDAVDGECPLMAALQWVYADCEWANIDGIAHRIWQPNSNVAEAWKYYLNRPQVDENSWCPPDVFMQNHDPARVVEPGEDIVMFFDGSKSNDYTALIGCCMSDGFVFTIGVWQPDSRTGVVNVHAVDAMVCAARDRWTVVAFFADVREWESYVKDKWAKLYKDDLLLWALPRGQMPEPVAWDMRTKAWQFGEATETCLNEIVEGTFKHDGNPDLVSHVSNCRVKEVRGQWYVKKESPKSRRKIDAAVCMIGARMVYRMVKASPKWEKRSSVSASFGFGW